MINAKFVCKNCGYKFETKVFEPGEAEEKGIPTGPVRCPKCGNAVERI